MRYEKIIDEQGSSITSEQLKIIFSILSQVKYGSINLVIHDGKIIQIERNEKIRLK